MATIEEMTLQLRILAWGMTNMEDARHRMSKEIAQELKKKMGDGAYLFCVEKLAGNTEQPKLWRHVLDWLVDIDNDPASAGSLTKGETNEGS
jgi:hypothetical protein